MREGGEEKPVGPNGHGAILEGPVLFTPEQAARFEQIKSLDETFIERFKKLRAEKAEKKAPPKMEDEKLRKQAEADLAKWLPGTLITTESPLPAAKVPSDAISDVERLTYVPGLVGELVEWNVRTARFPSRVMALASALAVVGKLLDRNAAGPTRSGT